MAGVKDLEEIEKKKKIGIKDFWNSSSTDMKAMQIVLLAFCVISIVGLIVGAIALAMANSNKKEIQKPKNNNQPQYNNNLAYQNPSYYTNYSNQ